MIEGISTSVVAQTKTAQTVKAAENAEAQKASEKEQPEAQTNELRKRDRFVSSEVLRYGSPDDPQARKAFDEMHKAAKTAED